MFRHVSPMYVWNVCITGNNSLDLESKESLSAAGQLTIYWHQREPSQEREQLSVCKFRTVHCCTVCKLHLHLVQKDSKVVHKVSLAEEPLTLGFMNGCLTMWATAAPKHIKRSVDKYHSHSSSASVGLWRVNIAGYDRSHHIIYSLKLACPAFPAFKGGK